MSTPLANKSTSFYSRNSRVAGLMLLGVALFFGMLAAFLSQSTSPTIFLAFIFGLLGVPLTLNGFLLYATTDTNGIRWRNWRGTHQASWSDIADFYEVLPQSSSGRSQHLLGSEVITRQGEKLFIPLDWHQREQLRQQIATRSLRAAAPLTEDGSRIWLAQGARSADFPATFTYDLQALRKEGRYAIGLTLFLTLLCSIPVGLVLTILAFLNFRNPAIILIFLLIFTIPALILGGITLLRAIRSAQARRDARTRASLGERFEANQEGLTFYTEGEGRTIPWNLIVGYDFVLPLPSSPVLAKAPVCRIRSADSREFQVTNRISNFPLLQYLLRSWSPDAVEARKESEQKEDLGGIAARWTGGEEGKGDRIYHCRTRATRTQLLFCGLMCLTLVAQLIFVMMDWLRGRNPGSHDSPKWFQSLLFVAYLPICAYTALRFWTERIILRKDGIVRHFARRETFLPWAEVADIRDEGANLIIEGIDGKKISFTPSQYAYGSEIKERIAEYRRPYLHRVTQADVADVPLTMTAPPSPVAQEKENVQIMGRVNGG